MADFYDLLAGLTRFAVDKNAQNTVKSAAQKVYHTVTTTPAPKPAPVAAKPQIFKQPSPAGLQAITSNTPVAKAQAPTSSFVGPQLPTSKTPVSPFNKPADLFSTIQKAVPQVFTKTLEKGLSSILSPLKPATPVAKPKAAIPAKPSASITDFITQTAQPYMKKAEQFIKNLPERATDEELFAQWRKEQLPTRGFFNQPSPFEFKDLPQATKDKYQKAALAQKHKDVAFGEAFKNMSVQDKVNAVGKIEDFGDRIKYGFNTIGSALQDFAQERRKESETALTKTQNPAEQAFIRGATGVFATPAEQVGTGLKELSGGETGRAAPEYVKGAGNLAFGALSVLPSTAGVNAIFNAAMEQPIVKNIATPVFEKWQEAKDFVLESDAGKMLPKEVRDGLSLAADLYVFHKLNQAAKLPFKKMTDIEVPNPLGTGEMVKLRVPIDRKWWSDLQTDIGDMASKLRTNPMEIFNKISLTGTKPGFIKNPFFEEPAKPFLKQEAPVAPEVAAPLADRGIETQGEPGKRGVMQEPLMLPKPKYVPEQSEALIKEGGKKITPRENFSSTKQRIITEYYDENAPLLQPNKKGVIGKSYLHASEFTSKLGGEVRSGLDELQQIYEKVPARLQPILDDIQVHRQLVDRGKIGLKNPLNISSSQALDRLADVVGKLTPKDQKLIFDAETQIREWNDRTIVQPMVDAGIIPEATAKNWKEKYPNHLPVDVVHYLESNGMSDLNFSSKKPNTKFLKTAEGTQSQMDTDTFRVRARQLMRVKGLIAKDRVTSEILKDFGDEIKTDLNSEQYTARNPGNSLVIDPATKTKYSVPTEISNVISGMNAQSIGLLEGMFSKGAAALRTGATAGKVPFAILSNPIRDVTAVKTLMGKKFSVLRHQLPSQMEALMNNLGVSKSEYIEALKKSGGLLSGPIQSEKINVQRSEFQPKTRMTTGDKIWGTVKKLDPFYRVAKFLGGSIEEGTRVAATRAWDSLNNADKSKVLTRLNPKYKVYVTGTDPADVDQLRSFMTRRSTLDFTQMGNKMRIANRVIPFLNATQKGFARFYGMAANDPAHFAKMGFKYAAIPSLMSYGWNQAHGGTDDIDEYTRESNWVFKTGIMVKGNNGSLTPLVVAIPKLPGIKEISNVVEGSLDAVTRHDTKLLKQAFPTLYNLATGDVKAAGAGVLHAIPNVPVITPLLESAANYDFYRQRPIVSQGVENKTHPELEYDQNTPEVWKQLGQLTGTSPKQIEHFINSIYPATTQYTSTADILSGKGSAQDASTMFPLLKTSYDTSGSEAYASAQATRDDTKARNFKIREQVDKIVHAKTKAEAKAVTDQLATMELNEKEDQYATEYLDKILSRQGKSAEETAVYEMSSKELVNYLGPKLRTAIEQKDKAEIVRLSSMIKPGSSAEEALSQYLDDLVTQ